jgi:organic radical activating enzyme
MTDHQHEPSLMEELYTSTGRKFWKHPEQMEAYRLGLAPTAISTHVSPEGACNLSCPYCSVSKRILHARIDFETIQDYLYQLKRLGLKAVIFTGGGEPTAYPEISELILFARHELDLKCALITNGTLGHRVRDEAWKSLSWVRVSVNFFPLWEERIELPVAKLNPDCVVGLSTVFTDRHESPKELTKGWLALYRQVAALADRVQARYVRVLPNCLLPQDELLARHEKLEQIFAAVGDRRFFHQFKVHGAPSSNYCHQAHFRPYLSEEPNPWDGTPGTVFPCDSVVLNAAAPGEYGHQKFMGKYAICKPGDITKFMELKREQKFYPPIDCQGCVFTKNVEMLDHWQSGRSAFAAPPETLEHEEFV